MYMRGCTISLIGALAQDDNAIFAAGEPFLPAPDVPLHPHATLACMMPSSAIALLRLLPEQVHRALGLLGTAMQQMLEELLCAVSSNAPSGE